METVFVRNRVAAIHELNPQMSWDYVSTTENPADLISRGCDYDQFQTNAHWWHAPKWLLEPTSTRPCADSTADDTLKLAEEEQLKSTLCITVTFCRRRMDDHLRKATFCIRSDVSSDGLCSSFC